MEINEPVLHLGNNDRVDNVLICPKKAESVITPYLKVGYGDESWPRDFPNLLQFAGLVFNGKLWISATPGYHGRICNIYMSKQVEIQDEFGTRDIPNPLQFIGLVFTEKRISYEPFLSFGH